MSVDIALSRPTPPALLKVTLKKIPALVN